MGYTTEFEGYFKLDKPLSKEQAAYLNEFSATRRMKRDVTRMQRYSDPIRDAVRLPLGVEGEFYVGSGDGNPDKPNKERHGQGKTPDILDYNQPSSTQPGLWCQWVPTKDHSGIEWDGTEKCYEYVKWLRYIVENFLKPWGLTLNGAVLWQGEEMGDRGELVVTDNVVSQRKLI